MVKTFYVTIEFTQNQEQQKIFERPCGPKWHTSLVISTCTYMYTFDRSALMISEQQQTEADLGENVC